MFKSFKNILVLSLLSLAFSSLTGRLLQTSSIELKYIEAEQFYTVPITVGNSEEPQVFEVQVDTTTSETWFPSILTNYTVQPKYDASASNSSKLTNQTIEVDDEDGDVSGKATYDLIKIGEYSIKNFGFVQIENYPTEFKDYPRGKLGIGLKQDHGDNFDFLRMLKNEKAIEKEIITINPFNKTLFIGNIPPEVNETTYTHCNTTPTIDLDDDYRQGWACELSHVYYGSRFQDTSIDDAEDVSARIMFDSAYKYISIPSKFLSEFKKRYIEPIFNDTCTQVKENGDEIYFICDYDPVQLNFADITFLIEGYGYVIHSKDLFVRRAEDKMELLVRFYNENDNIWSFGTPFTSNHIIVYNKEEGQVGFDGGEKYDLNEEWTMWLNGETKAQKKQRLFFLILCASIIGGVLLLVVICLIVRSCKRRKLEEHGPMIEQN